MKRAHSNSIDQTPELFEIFELLDTFIKNHENAIASKKALERTLEDKKLLDAFNEKKEALGKYYREWGIAKGFNNDPEIGIINLDHYLYNRGYRFVEMSDWISFLERKKSFYSLAACCQNIKQAQKEKKKMQENIEQR